MIGAGCCAVCCHREKVEKHLNQVVKEREDARLVEQARVAAAAEAAIASNAASGITDAVGGQSAPGFDGLRASSMQDAVPPPLPGMQSSQAGSLSRSASKEADGDRSHSDLALPASAPHKSTTSLLPPASGGHHRSSTGGGGAHSGAGSSNDDRTLPLSSSTLLVVPSTVPATSNGDLNGNGTHSARPSVSLNQPARPGHRDSNSVADRGGSGGSGTVNGTTATAAASAAVSSAGTLGLNVNLASEQQRLLEMTQEASGLLAKFVRAALLSGHPWSAIQGSLELVRLCA